MKNSSIKIAILLFFLPFASFSQGKYGLHYGIILGWYAAGNSESQMYNCSTSTDVNLSQILNNTTNYSKLQEYYNDDFTLYELPQNIKYKPTISVGGTLQLSNEDETFGIFLHASYLSPSIKNSNFSIKLLSKSTNYSDNVIEQGVISAKENRFNFSLGIHKLFRNDWTCKPYIEAALEGTFLEMKSHEISIGNLTQSVLYYSQSDANTNYSKFGYGASLSAGLKIPLVKTHSVFIGGSLTAMHFGITDDTFSYAKAINCYIWL